MKFHKAIGGRTALGDSQIKVVSEMRMPFAHQFIDGVEAYRKGDFYETRVSKVDDGYYTLGQVQPGIDPGAPSYIRASPDGRNFTGRGVFAPEVSLITPAIEYAGNGWGFVVSEPSPGLQRVHRTRNGRSFQTWLDYSYTADPFSPGRASTFPPPAAYRTASGRIDWAAGLAYLLIEPDGTFTDIFPNGDWQPLYARYLEGEWLLGLTLGYGSGVWHGRPNVFRVGPKTLVMITPVYRKADSEPPGTTPPPFFTVSRDNGDTWQFIDAPTFISDRLPAGETSRAVYNSNVARLCRTCSALPINNDECYLTLLDLADPVTSPRWSARFNLNTGAVSDVHEIPMPLAPEAPGGGFFYKEVTLVVLTPGHYTFFFADADRPEDPIEIRTTTNLTTWIETTTTSFPAEMTGEPFTIDERTMRLPVYDAEGFSIYESKDRGLTWERKGTIDRTAAAPPDTDDWVLQRFGAVTALRRNGQPAHAVPSLPWVGDERVQAP